MEKTLAIKRAEFTQMLAQLINNSELPPFVIADSLALVLKEIEMLANQQLQKDLQDYKNASAEEVVELKEVE